MVGGVCINTGTIPSKTLREAVLYLTGLNQRELYGQNYRVKDDITVMDLTARTQHVIGREIEVVRSQLFRNGVDLVHGTGRFLDPHTVGVRAEHDIERTVTGSKIVIATGTRPAHPPTVDFDDSRILDSDGILQPPTSSTSRRPGSRRTGARRGLQGRRPRRRDHGACRRAARPGAADRSPGPGPAPAGPSADRARTSEPCTAEPHGRNLHDTPAAGARTISASRPPTRGAIVSVQSAPPYDYDLLVLGSGPGGQKAAIAAAKLGRRAAVVERRAHGRRCLHQHRHDPVARRCARRSSTSPA